MHPSMGVGSTCRDRNIGLSRNAWIDDTGREQVKELIQPGKRRNRKNKVYWQLLFRILDQAKTIYHIIILVMYWGG